LSIQIHLTMSTKYHVLNLLALLLKRTLNLMLILNLKLCSQRLCLLKLLRDQGLPQQNLNIVFNSLILSRLQYALPAWSGFLSADSVGMVNSLLKRAFKYSYTNFLYTSYIHLRHSVMTLINVSLERYIMNINAFMIDQLIN